MRFDLKWLTMPAWLRVTPKDEQCDLPMDHSCWSATDRLFTQLKLPYLSRLLHRISGSFRAALSWTSSSTKIMAAASTDAAQAPALLPEAAVPEGFRVFKEGMASILQKGNDVFYNEAQVTNRDLSVAVLRHFLPLLEKERAEAGAKGGGGGNKGFHQWRNKRAGGKAAAAEGAAEEEADAVPAQPPQVGLPSRAWLGA